MKKEYVCSIGIAGSTFHRGNMSELNVNEAYLLRHFLEANPEIDDLSFSRQVDGEEENTVIKLKVDGKVSGEK